MGKRQKIILPSLIEFLVIIMVGMTACSDNYLPGSNVASNSITNVSSSINPATTGGLDLSNVQIVLGPTSAHVVANGPHSLQPQSVQPNISGGGQLTVSLSLSHPSLQKTVISASAPGVVIQLTRIKQPELWLQSLRTTEAARLTIQ